MAARVASDYQDGDSTAGNSKRAAVFNGGRAGALSRKTWTCSHCTLRNPNSAHECDACGRSTNGDYIENSMIEPTDEDQLDDVQASSGWTCVHCTFVNDHSTSHICVMCGKTHENRQQTRFEDVKPALTKTIRRLMSNNDLSFDEAREIELSQHNSDEESMVVELIETYNDEQPNSPLQSLKIFRRERVALTKSTAAKKLSPSKNKLSLMVNIIEMGFEVKDVIAAVDGSCTSVNEALTLIARKRECLSCLEKFTANKMFTLFCHHEMCRPCAVRYFTERIRDHSNVNEIVCPVNGCSDDKKLDYEYFNMLANQLKPLLDNKVFDLFQTKLRHQTIGKINDFVYCTKCPGFGFEYDPRHESVTCPECRHSMCPKCKADWTEDHKSRSCDEM